MATNAVLAKLAIQISANTAELGRALSATQNQLKGFQNSITNLGRAIGISFGAAALVQGIKEVVGVASEFERTMSEVKAITGATGDEFKALEKDALRLGASTKYTASQVGQLQVAYGRLGFNTKEILDATEATLALAAATGEDLAKSADVAGSTVRGFGLEARETQRVVDVMAKSFNTTALGLENFTEAMKYVAPVAAAANLSVEETTALLGTLADAGLRGSMAGTALRKILTDLPKDGRPFQERLEELSKKGITLGDAMDEVGRTAQTALLVLTKNNAKTRELAASFQNVAGEAEKMARVMQDNLQGDIEKLSSAWEGMILRFTNTQPIRNATQALTALIAGISGGTPDAMEGLKTLAQGIKAGVTESNSGFQIFIDKLSEVRREAGKPIDTSVVSELAEKYKLTDEQANLLYRSILQVNEALSFNEKAIKQFNEFAERNFKDARTGVIDYVSALDAYKSKLYELILQEQIRESGLQKVADTSAEAARTVKPQIDAAKAQQEEYRRVILVLNEYARGFEKTTQAIQESTQATVLNLEFYKDALKKLNTEFEGVALSGGQFGEVTAQAASQLRVLAAQGAGLDEFIKRVERLKESFRNFDVIIKTPDLTPLLNGMKTITETAGALTFEKEVTSFEAVVARFEAGLAKLATSTKSTFQEVKGSFIDFGGLITGAASGIGEALGNAAVGAGNFGKDILKVVVGFARQLGEILVAAGVAMLAAKKLIKNPYTAIIGGTLLIAAAAAAGAAINKSHSNAFGGSGASGGNVAASSTSVPRSATEAQDVKVTGTIIARGQDLWVVLSNYEQNNRFTKANG